MTFYKAIKIFNYSLTSFLVVLIGLLSFIGAGATNNNSRVIDGRLGILQFPVELAYGVGDNLQVVNNSVDVSAQIDINQGIQNALLLISRAAFRAFLKALLGFFTQSFLKLLDQMSAAASKIFGLRLDFGAVKKVIVAKANKLEKSVDSFVDGILGISSTDSSSAINKTSAVETIKKAVNPISMEDAMFQAGLDLIGTSSDSGSGSGTASTSAKANKAEQIEEDKKAFTELAASILCLKEKESINELAQTKNGGVGARMLGFQCFGYLDYKNTAALELNNRVSNIKQNSNSSMKSLLDQAPADCKRVSLDTRSSEKETPDFKNPESPTAPGGASETALSAASQFLADAFISGDSDKILEALDKTPVVPVSKEVCDSTGVVNAAISGSQAAIQVTSGNETDIIGEFLNALAETLIDFINQLLSKVLDIIVNVINNIFNQLSKLSSSLGGNPLSSAIGEGLNAGIAEARTQVATAKAAVDKALKEAVDAANKSIQATSFIEKAKMKDEAELELALNPQVNLS